VVLGGSHFRFLRDFKSQIPANFSLFTIVANNGRNVKSSFYKFATQQQPYVTFIAVMAFAIVMIPAVFRLDRRKNPLQLC